MVRTATLQDRLFWIILLSVSVLVVYLPVFRAGYIWDDDDYIVYNPVIRTPGGLVRMWFEPSSLPQYYPMVHTTYWLEYRLWGLDPKGYHVTNVVLHAFAALLLWSLLRRLQIKAAFFAAAVFALHPVNVESVAWITERKNVLSGVFYLLALYFWLRWQPVHTPEKNTGEPVRPGRFYWWSLTTFVLALLSKTVACSLPAVILLLIWWKRGRIPGRLFAYTLPMFAAGFVLAIVTALTEWLHVGAKGMEWELSLLERCLVAGRAIWFYAGKLVWPASLSFNYVRWNIDAAVWWQYIFPAGFLVLVVALWFFRRRIGRGPLTAVLIFSGTLVPALGLFNIYPMVYSYVADHFQYFAAMALITLFAETGYLVLKRNLHLGPGIIHVVAGVVLIALGIRTWSQGHIYENRETLWLDTIEKNPDSWLAFSNLGGIRVDQNRYEEAIPLLKRGLEIKETNPTAHNNMGIALMQTQDIEGAKMHLRRTIELRPNFPQPYNNLAVLLWRQRNTEEAIDLLEKAVALVPHYTDANRNLAAIYFERGDIGTGARYALAVFKANPGETLLVKNLAQGIVTNSDSLPVSELERLFSVSPVHLAVILDATAKEYALIQQYESAAVFQKKAIDVASRAGLSEQVRSFQRRLKDYENRN